MLEYSKTVLQKVSFHPGLFKKELMKSLQWLKKEEVILLQVWCVVWYNDRYSEIIREVFRNISQ